MSGRPRRSSLKRVLPQMRKLEHGSKPFVTVDVSERPELAERYGIALVPTVLEVAANGDVVRQLVP